MEQNNNQEVLRQTKKERKIYCIRGATGYANWMQGTSFVDTIEEADLVVAPGGGDVDPRLYGAKKGHRAAWGHTYMENDKELTDLRKAISLGKHIWGTCKGIQYGSCLSSGSMIADISHPWMHEIKTEDGKKFVVNSMHHMMVYPFDLPKEDYRIIGWSENLSDHHHDADENEMNPPVEPEIIYFPKTKFLGTQWHPEGLNKDSEPVKYCQDLLNRFLDDKL